MAGYIAIDRYYPKFSINLIKKAAPTSLLFFLTSNGVKYADISIAYTHIYIYRSLVTGRVGGVEQEISEKLPNGFFFLSFFRFFGVDNFPAFANLPLAVAAKQ